MWKITQYELENVPEDLSRSKADQYHREIIPSEKAPVSVFQETSISLNCLYPLNCYRAEKNKNSKVLTFIVNMCQALC